MTTKKPKTPVWVYLLFLLLLILIGFSISIDVDNKLDKWKNEYIQIEDKPSSEIEQKVWDLNNKVD